MWVNLVIQYVPQYVLARVRLFVNNGEFFVLYIENKVITRLLQIWFTSELFVSISFKLIQSMWLWKPSEKLENTFRSKYYAHDSTLFKSFQRYVVGLEKGRVRSSFNIKGQLISECLFDFLNFPKNHQKIDKFLPKDLKSGQIIREMSLYSLNSPYNQI